MNKDVPPQFFGFLSKVFTMHYYDSSPKKSFLRKVGNAICWMGAGVLLVLFVIIVTMEDYQRERFSNLLMQMLS